MDGTYHSIYGEEGVRWEREDDKVILTVRILPIPLPACAWTRQKRFWRRTAFPLYRKVAIWRQKPGQALTVFFSGEEISTDLGICKIYENTT